MNTYQVRRIEDGKIVYQCEGESLNDAANKVVAAFDDVSLQGHVLEEAQA